MSPDRSLRITFSHSSAFAPTRFNSAGSITSPAVFNLELWQVTQYWVKTAAGVCACADATKNPKAKVNSKTLRLTCINSVFPGIYYSPSEGTHEKLRRLSGTCAVRERLVSRRNGGRSALDRRREKERCEDHSCVDCWTSGRQRFRG